MAKYAMIAALSENYVIADNGDIPWDIDKDFEHYLETVAGSTLVSGRKTYEDMGRRNPGDKIVVLTRQEDYTVNQDDGYVAHGKEEAMSIVDRITDSDETVYVVGGEDIYRMFLDTADELVLSHIHEEYAGDTYFPEIDEDVWTVDRSKQYEQFTIKYYSRSVDEQSTQ